MNEVLPTLTRRQILAAFVGLLLGILLGALDELVVATALPTIVGDLGGLGELAWVVTVYLLAATPSIPLWGKFGDVYGRKRVFQVSVLVFLAGSALCGTATSMAQLIGFRALQGLGAGGLFTLPMAIVGDLVSPRERGRYQGFIQAVFALATIIGPLIGGTIVDHLNWRWIFYVNLPIGLVALVVVAVAMRLPNQARQHAIDYPGAGLLIGSVMCLLLALTWGGTLYPWISAQIIGLAVGAVAFAVTFVQRERHAPEPMLPLQLLRDPVLAISSAGLFCAMGAFLAAVVFLPVFFQLVKGATATNSGLVLLPMVLAITVSAIVVGRVISVTGRYKAFPILGLGLMTVTLVLFSQMVPATDPILTGVLMVAFGVGYGMVPEVLIMAVQNAVDHRNLGTAIGAVNLFRTLGGSVGVALYGSLFASQLDRFSAPSRRVGPADIRTLSDAARGDIALAVSGGLAEVFVAAGVVAAIGCLLTLFLHERPLRRFTGLETQALASGPQERARLGL